jgi:hypothetical protein
MLIIFFDSKGAVDKEFVLESQTDNSAYYCDVLRKLRERLRLELWRQNNWLLRHDNAPTHTSVFTSEFLTNFLKILYPARTATSTPR